MALTTKCPDCNKSKSVIEKNISGQDTIFCQDCYTVISYKKCKDKIADGISRDYNISKIAKINTYHHLDCLIGMKEFPDNYFNLAIIDPPYGIDVNKMNLGSGKYKTDKKWDLKPPSKEYFKELFRVSQNQILWGANHYIDRINKNSSCWLVWDKRNGTSDFADCELAWTSFNNPVRKFSFNLSQQSKKETKNRFHSTQKPIHLYLWILKMFAYQTDIILDTHVGSGNSIIAFENFGCKYVGYEIDEEYYYLGTQNINNYKNNGDVKIDNEIGTQLKLL